MLCAMSTFRAKRNRSAFPAAIIAPGCWYEGDHLHTAEPEEMTVISGALNVIVYRDRLRV